MVTGGGGRGGGDGKTLGHGGLSPYLIPFLSTPPRSPDSGGPTLCTGGGGRRAGGGCERRSPRLGRGSLPAGCGGGGAAAALRAARLGSAGGQRALPDTVLQPCCLRPSLCLSLSPGGSRTCGLAACSCCQFLRCLPYPRAGIDRSLV